MTKMIRHYMMHELLEALKWVYFILSLIGFIAIGICFLDDKKHILELIPICPMKIIGENCILCGSSTAFYLIGSGNILEAWQKNYLAVIIFGCILINSIVLSTIIFKSRLISVFFRTES